MPVLGLIAGFLSGLLGIGGGIVLVPALIYLLPTIEDVNEANVTLLAIATSLFTIVITAFSSGRSHFKRGNVDFKLALPVVLSVAVSSILATQVASKMSSSSLTLIFAILLMTLALHMLTGRKKLVEQDITPARWQLLLGGTGTGFLAAIAGLGGGAILVPYLSHIGTNIRKSIGTAAVCGMVVAFFGSAGYMLSGWHWTDSGQFIGYVHWPSAVLIMLFSYFAAPLGVKVGQKLDQMQLKKVFAVFMMLVSTKLLFEQLTSVS